MAVLGLFAVAALLFVTPTGFGHPTGMFKDTGDYPAAFPQVGCTSCHGGAKFTPGDFRNVQYSMAGPDGAPLTGNAYEKGKVYTINVTLLNEQNPDKANHAGFNLGASAGKLSATDPNVQVSKDQTQATHKNPGETHWSVEWTAPDSGAAAFDLFVNDVDGDQGASPGDHVYRASFCVVDPTGQGCGAAAPVKDVEFGISLQQYWIGLIGLAGMIFVMVAGYVYLKYVTPHNTDQKDR